MPRGAPDSSPHWPNTTYVPQPLDRTFSMRAMREYFIQVGQLQDAVTAAKETKASG